MLSVNVTADLREVQRYLNDAQKKAVPNAAARALNRAARSVRADAGKKGGAVHSDRRIKPSEIKKRIAVFPAKRHNLVALLIGKGRPVPLIAYGPRQTSRGVSVNIRGQGRKLIRGAFIATMKSGHRGVFSRRRIGGKRVGRLPIDELYSTTVADAMNNPHVRGAMYRKARERWGVEFERELRHALRQIR